jgi:type I restriction enzyme, S subunit
MIDGLRPYPEMKPTGLPWLGDVPAHWEVRRNGRLFGARRETGFPDLPILEVSIRSGVRVRDFDNGARKQEMADRSKYQRAVRGDIAYNMMRMWQGAVGIAPTDGLVSPAYVVARPYPETDAAYYAYLFRTAAYMRETDTFSRGIVPDRNRLYWESFKQMPSAYPPFAEQRLIVRFLDWHGAQTAKLIRAKKKLIALLNEQKQAIIHRAVTRGLGPNVKLKPSGIPWLGDVPEGWEVKRLKTIAQNKIEQKSFRSDGEIYVALEHIESWSARSEPRRSCAAMSKVTTTRSALRPRSWSIISTSRCWR